MNEGTKFATFNRNFCHCKQRSFHFSKSRKLTIPSWRHLSSFTAQCWDLSTFGCTKVSDLSIRRRFDTGTLEMSPFCILLLYYSWKVSQIVLIQKKCLRFCLNWWTNIIRCNRQRVSAFTLAISITWSSTTTNFREYGWWGRYGWRVYGRCKGRENTHVSVVIKLVFQEESEAIKQAKMEREEINRLQKLFENSVFFLNREVPRESLAFAIRSCGGQVGWDNSDLPGSHFNEEDEKITHHIVDRPNIDKKKLNRLVWKI